MTAPHNRSYAKSAICRTANWVGCYIHWGASLADTGVYAAVHIPNTPLGKNIDGAYGFNETIGSLIEGKDEACAIEKITIDKTPLVIPSIPKQLLTSIKDNKCVLFAGAGASMDAKSPSWNELIVALVDCLKDEYSDLADRELKEIEKLLCERKYLVLAEYCLKKLDPYDFSRVLKLNRQGKTIVLMNCRAFK